MMEQSNYRIDSILVKPDFLKYLMCPICMDVLSDAVIDIKNQHILCKSCVQSGQCPICREEVDFQEAKLARQLLENLEVRCLFDEDECSWKGHYRDLNKHLLVCPVIMATNMAHLQEVLQEMRGTLDIEFNEHLMEFHSDLYENIVQGWEYLSNDLNQWDFWMSYMEHPCEICNILIEKYQDPLEQLDEQRQQLIKQMDL